MLGAYLDEDDQSTKHPYNTILDQSSSSWICPRECGYHFLQECAEEFASKDGDVDDKSGKVYHADKDEED